MHFFCACVWGWVKPIWNSRPQLETERTETPTLKEVGKILHPQDSRAEEDCTSVCYCQGRDGCSMALHVGSGGGDVRVFVGFHWGCRGGKESAATPKTTSEEAKGWAYWCDPTCTEHRHTAGKTHEEAAELQIIHSTVCLLGFVYYLCIMSAPFFLLLLLFLS